MKCLVCESLSLLHICKTCQVNFLKPSLYKRKIFNNVEVISFYKYQDIKNFLHTKHTDLGYYIYKILAQNSLKLFAKDFDIDSSPTVSIAVCEYELLILSSIAMETVGLESILKSFANNFKEFCASILYI
jgi:hypothetical protein